MARFGEINAQYFDDSGDPLSSGKIYFYETGTTTLKNTFSDINQTIANTNPVILTAAGRQPNVFFSGNAKAILVNSSDVQILVRDPVGQTASAFGDAWVATKIYDADAVVLGSDGVYYRSLVSANQNNNPTSTSGYWTLLYSIEWNAGITYSAGDIVTVGTTQFQSLQNNNLNQNPATQPSFWVSIAFAWLSTQTYAIHQNVVGPDGILYTSLQNSNLNNTPASSGAYWVGTSAAAAASATAAAGSASTASTQATNAAASATTATTQATAATTAKTAAETAKTAAETAQTAAETAKTNAETAETNAANSASASATSAAAALVSQNAAATSATAAASSESTVATDAAAASTSATNASNSATAAAGSATTATTQASTATTQAGIATTKAGEAATSATAAATSATASATSATASAGSATSSSGSATSAAASLADFNTKYLGAHATAPTGTAAGQQYFNTTSNLMFVYTGSAWTESGSSVNGTSNRVVVTATAAQTNFSITYDVGYVDVYLNGSKLQAGTDFTATNGVTVVLTTGAASGDIVDMVAYGAFNVANVYTQTESDARFAQLSNNLSDLASASTALTNLGLTADAAEINKLDGMTASKAELNYVSGVTSSIQTQLNNISPSPTLVATASGALANGDLVIVNADGTVSVVNETINSTPSVGSSVVFESAQTISSSVAYDTSQNKIVVAYSDVGNSNIGTLVIGTVSGNSITFSSPVIFENANITDPSVVFDSNSNKIVICYTDNGNTYSGTAIVGTVSGNSISFGSPVVYQSAGAYYNKATFDSNTNKVVIAFSDASNSSHGTAIVGTVSGTSISFGSKTVFDNNACDQFAITFDSNVNKVCIFWRDQGNNLYGTGIVGTVSGTGISFGLNKWTYNSATTVHQTAVFDSNSNKVVIAYRDGGNSNAGTARVVSLSGTDMSFGTAVVYNATRTDSSWATYDPVANKIAIAYADVGNTKGEIVIGTVSGTDISFTTPIVFQADNVGYIGSAFDSNADRVAIAYMDHTGGNYYGTGIVLETQQVTRNLTAENYIGISDGAYANAASANIQIVGAVDDAQSGLTAGQKYYVQNDNTLGLTATTPEVFAGTAVSATKLIIKG